MPGRRGLGSTSCWRIARGLESLERTSCWRIARAALRLGIVWRCVLRRVLSVDVSDASCEQLSGKLIYRFSGTSVASIGSRPLLTRLNYINYRVFTSETESRERKFISGRDGFLRPRRPNTIRKTYNFYSPQSPT